MALKVKKAIEKIVPRANYYGEIISEKRTNDNQILKEKEESVFFKDLTIVVRARDYLFYRLLFTLKTTVGLSML